jgi:hypothetical protein
MEVLSFAAVGSHGRESWTRLAAACVLGAALSAQSAPSPDVATELATRIDAAIAPVRSIVLDASDTDADFLAALTSVLRTRGISLEDSGVSTAVHVYVNCGRNLRERLCTADIPKGAERTAIVVVRPKGNADDSATTPSLELRPLITLKDPILDVAILADDMLVLQPSGVSLRRRTANGTSSRISTAPIPQHRWPRDVRGRLQASSGAIHVFMPGVTCHGRVSPLALSCADEREPWPIPIDNQGIAATRNYFLTPEGVAFFNAAAIPVAGRTRWIAVDLQGGMTFLDERRAVSASIGHADDLVNVQSGTCASDPYIATVARSETSPGAESAADDLALFRAAGGQLTAISKVQLGGVETALWPGADAATLVVRDTGSSLYEAFHIRVACAR